MTVYKSIPGIEAVRLDGGAVLLRTDMLSCRLEGESALVAAERLLPALGRWRTAEAIKTLLPDYAGEDIEALVGELASAGFVHRRSEAPDDEGPPAAAAFAGMGIDEVEAGRRLAALGIGLVGLDRIGRLVADALAEAGVGRLLLADPLRQQPAAAALADAAAGTRVELAPAPLDRAAVEALADGLDLLIVSVGRDFLAARHWANRAALRSGCPALFVDASLAEALVGPTVLPGESACYMCFRMRHLATLDRFAEAMARERELDARKDVAASPILLPGVAEAAAGLVVNEAIRLLFGPLIPALVNGVTQLDVTTGRLEHHSVLRQPDCPECRGIDVAVRRGG